MVSDKITWHRYIDAYEAYVFRDLVEPKAILEYGVLHGASIEFLEKRFPNTIIVGADITIQSELAASSSAVLIRLDQTDVKAIKYTLPTFPQFDLIIDDGSHRPEDQLVCIRASFPFVRSGGFYIVEDIHTNEAEEMNLYRMLLKIDHLRDIGRKEEADAIDEFSSSIDKIIFFKRAQLPRSCWGCRGTDFDYVKLKCSCGHDLMRQWDSMACILRKK